jgi:hypothetical protein
MDYLHGKMCTSLLHRLATVLQMAHQHTNRDRCGRNRDRQCLLVMMSAILHHLPPETGRSRSNPLDFQLIVLRKTCSAAHFTVLKVRMIIDL